ncbi:hypothetical protein DFJ73DRAFT_883479 [Zopfochytrium polystomum]|nr:hypothetical protein DFJ73DRAFT_883479 [Zopfochytrium polystomum]
MDYALGAGGAGGGGLGGGGPVRYNVSKATSSGPNSASNLSSISSGSGGSGVRSAGYGGGPVIAAGAGGYAPGFAGYAATSAPPVARNSTVFVEFLVSRPTLDLPPFEIQLCQPMPALAQTRTIDGVVRITVDPSPTGFPLLAEKLVLRFRGGRAGAHETLLKLLLWQPGSKEEFDRGLLPGRHDFPFALDIPSSLHASAEGAKVPQMPPGPAGHPSDHFRTYELTATLHSFVNNMMVEDEAFRTVNVRRCYPLPWLFPDPPLQRTIGTTSPGGELAFRVLSPKVWSFGDRREMEIDIAFDDGSDTTSRIAGIECVLMQRLRHRDAPTNGLPVSVGDIPATIASPVGQVIKSRPPPLNLGTSTMKMVIDIPNGAMQPDAELDPFLLEHLLHFTVSVTRMMMTKKATFTVPIRMVIPADNDDRVLNSIPPPPQWASLKEASAAPKSSGRSITASSLSSGSSGKNAEKVSTNDLGFRQVPLPRGKNNAPASASKLGGSPGMSRRPSGSSQGSGGGRRYQDPLVGAMDSMVLGSQSSGQRAPRSGSRSPSLFSSNSMMAGANPGGAVPTFESYSAAMGAVPPPASVPNLADFYQGNPPSPASTVSYFPASNATAAKPVPLPSQVQPRPFGAPAPGGALDFRRVQQQQQQQAYVPSPTLSGGGGGGGAQFTTSPGTSGTSSQWDQQVGQYAAQRLQQPPHPPPNQPLPPTPVAPPRSANTTIQNANLPPPVAPLPATAAAASAALQPLTPPPSSVASGGSGAATAGAIDPSTAAAAAQQPIQTTTATASSSSSSSSSSSATSPTSATAKHLFGVQFAFSPTLPDEVGLEAGDVVEVLEAFDDGWARGINTRSGASGYFPIRCLVLPPVPPEGG